MFHHDHHACRQGDRCHGEPWDRRQIQSQMIHPRSPRYQNGGFVGFWEHSAHHWLVQGRGTMSGDENASSITWHATDLLFLQYSQCLPCFDNFRTSVQVTPTDAACRFSLKLGGGSLLVFPLLRCHIINSTHQEQPLCFHTSKAGEESFQKFAFSVCST